MTKCKREKSPTKPKLAQNLFVRDSFSPRQGGSSPINSGNRVGRNFLIVDRRRSQRAGKRFDHTE
jgi:hypothetical protein